MKYGIKSLYGNKKHTMNTFFSGTDMQELHDNVANYSPYYLSLIVNLKGEYTAKVAYLQKLNSRDIEITDEDGSIGTIKTQEKTVMFTFDLDVEIEGNEVSHPMILERLKEIRDKKKAATATKTYGFHQRATEKTQNVQQVIKFPLSLVEKVRNFLPTIIMQNDKYTGNIWQAFTAVNKEMDGDLDKADMIYNIWASNIYDQVLTHFECEKHDDVENIFKEMIRMLDNLKDHTLYGEHVKNFIGILDLYIMEINTEE